MPIEKHIDTHVHCRDGSQAYKATIESVAKLARKKGIVAIGDMPNTNPPICTSKDVEARIALAEKEGITEGYYLWVGMPNNPELVHLAVEAVDSCDKVLGIKMFAGTSVGDLSVPKAELQREVYRKLNDVGYHGVLALHCERESEFRIKLWNPDVPSSWNDARPVSAETLSVTDQITFAQEFGFKGTLHICHITSPVAVDIVEVARENLKITCGATPHHLTISTELMDALGGRDARIYKVNPPIRDEMTRQGLMDKLSQGKIDWIETDHAPHTLEEKLDYPYLSGIQSMNDYAGFLKKLEHGGFTAKQIDDLTYNNIKRVFRNIKE